MQRFILVAAALLSLLAGFVAFGSPAHAADTTAVNVIVMDESGQRLPDIPVTATATGFTEVTVSTNESGMASFDLPGGNTYTFTADATALPADAPGFVENPKTVEVKGIPTTLRFDVGEPSAAPSASASASAEAPESTPASANPEEGGVVAGTSFWQQLAQKLMSGLIFGLLLALASIGVSLIYGTTGLNNFAHGELVSFGGFVGWVVIGQIGASGWVGLLAALVIGGLFGWFQDFILWKPLRRRGVGLIQIMIVSIGLSLLLRYLFAFIWGPGRFLYPQEFTSVVTILGVGLTYWNVMGSIVAIVLIVAVALVLNYTKIGKATRAVADNKALAAASGINVDRVIRIVWIGGGALAAVSGVLVAYYQTLSFEMGASILLLIFAAVTLGGLGTTYGALIGSLLLSLFIELSTFVIPSSIKVVGALLIMILILLIRPQGILGKKQRVG